MKAAKLKFQFGNFQGFCENSTSSSTFKQLFVSNILFVQKAQQDLSLYRIARLTVPLKCDAQAKLTAIAPFAIVQAS